MILLITFTSTLWLYDALTFSCSIKFYIIWKGNCYYCFAKQSLLHISTLKMNNKCLLFKEIICLKDDIDGNNRLSLYSFNKEFLIGIGLLKYITKLQLYCNL